MLLQLLLLNDDDYYKFDFVGVLVFIFFYLQLPVSSGIICPAIVLCLNFGCILEIFLNLRMLSQNSRSVDLCIDACIQRSRLQPADSVPAYIQSLAEEPTDEQIVELAEVSEYKTAISSLLNEMEDLDSLERYKNAVKQLLLAPEASASTAD